MEKIEMTKKIGEEKEKEQRGEKRKREGERE